MLRRNEKGHQKVRSSVSDTEDLYIDPWTDTGDADVVPHPCSWRRPDAHVRRRSLPSPTPR